MRKKILSLVGALIFLAGSLTTVHALSSYLSTFTSTYSGTSGTVLNDCSLCHPGGRTSASNLNNFAANWVSNGKSSAAFTAINNLDSDGDGVTNINEINARTFPGDAASFPPPASDTIAPVVSGFTIPATSTSLTVAITTLTATDVGGVTGFMVTESSATPAAAAAGWSAAKPASYAFASAGVKTLYGWAKDGAGNVSAPLSRSVTITLPDTIAPVVSGFTIPATSTSLTVAITTLTATDVGGVTGFMVTESSATPAAAAAGWSAAKPASYAFASAGVKTLYGWAKDGAGNVSAPLSRSVTITLPDTIAPVVSGFTIPATSTSLTVAITTLTATDVGGVTGFMVTESSATPAAAAAGWSAAKPASYIFASAGVKTLYGWAKDGAGNVSAPLSRSVTITLPDTIAPVVSGFTIPATSTSLTVAIATLTATDAGGVTGYMVTATSATPAASAAEWTATKPASYTFTTAGSKTLYGWAKDAAGNVSAPLTALTTITLPDSGAPVVTGFAIPASSASLTVAITTLTATDAGGVTGYILTESATAPAASAAGWTSTAPASYTFASAGAKTLFAYAKDATGNISVPLSASITITLPDTAAPVITSFVTPTSSTSLTVPITACMATDNVGVTGHMITESATAPAASATGWTSTAPASYTFPSASTHTLYAYAKDAAGNVSAAASRTIAITLADATPPSVTSFIIPANSAALTVAITAFTATDNVGVTGYLVTESATAPAGSATGWSSTAPASYTCSSGGSKTLYAWAKDTAGNVSPAASSTVAITASDASAPVVTRFEVPKASWRPTVEVSLRARDNVGVTAYLVKEGSEAPTASASGWRPTAPRSYTFTSGGTKTLSAWAKDAAGNVSASVLRSVVVRWSGSISRDDDDDDDRERDDD